MAEDEHRKPKQPRNVAEGDPVLGIPDPRRKERHAVKGSLPERPRKKDKYIRTPMGYGVGVIQAETVTSALNALN